MIYNLNNFNLKFKKSKCNGCWVWTACKDKNGYGWFGRKKAHRVSYQIHVGEIPENMCVCHKCDNPSCVNPEHLFIGTNSDNVKDRNSKGRNKKCGIRGILHHNSKLNEDVVRDIKKRLKKNQKHQDIADIYFISHQTVSSIKRGLVWKHVEIMDDEEYSSTRNK